MWEKYSASCLLHFQVNGLYRLTIEKTKIKSAKQPSRSFFFFFSQPPPNTAVFPLQGQEQYEKSLAFSRPRCWKRMTSCQRQGQGASAFNLDWAENHLLQNPSWDGPILPRLSLWDLSHHHQHTHTHTYTNFILVTSQCDTLGFFDILCRYVRYRIISF